MKVLARATHYQDVSTGRPLSEPAGAAVHLTPGGEGERPLTFEAVYARSFHSVCRYLRANGAPLSEIEDLAQEVFLVVRNKLAQFDGRNLNGWLYRIAALTVRDHRRRAWFRRFFHRKRELPSQVAPHADPSEMVARRQAEARLADLLSRMAEKQRAAFVLFEIEGQSGEEIAAALEIPIATVWTRLHHARRSFAALLLEQQKREGA